MKLLIYQVTEVTEKVENYIMRTREKESNNS